MTSLVLDNLWVGGAIICLAVIAYILIEIKETLGRLAHNRRIQKLQAEQISIQIQRARKQQYKESQKSLAWTGTRKFVVAKTRIESLDNQIRSFYLQPHDEKPIPSFDPGQFLTFELNVPGTPGTVNRCYSLSDSPKDGEYRVTVKRLSPPSNQPEAPAGLSSNFFHDNVKKGDILDIRAPSGKFFLDTSNDRPIVLIGVGGGVTPVMSMLNTVITTGGDREVWFFYGIRNSREHAMRDHLKSTAATNSNVRINICYSNPGKDDAKGEDYDHWSYVSVDLFKAVLPSNNYLYLICGPPPMMESLISDLIAWGVPKHDILRENFGPASGRKSPVKEVNPDARGPEVSFKRSGKKVRWDPTFESLVKFAEAH